MLTQEQVKEAIAQMKVHCELKMQNYELCSARSTLYELGYDEEAAEDVLDYIYNNGFTYCLDHQYNSQSAYQEKPSYPSEDACYWGPDQLKSRLECIT